MSSFITVSIDDFDNETILEAARDITDTYIGCFSDADRDFLIGHFEKMSDEMRKAGDILKAAEFDKFRDYLKA